MTAPGSGAERVPETLIDLSRFAAGLRWRRRIWLSFATVGVLAGVAAAVLTPSAATATARIYVVHEESTDGESAMKTDLAVLETSMVAAESIKRLGITMSPENFAGAYTGDVVAANVLEVTAKGADEHQAVDRAQAVADAFITMHVKRVDDAAQAEIKILTDRSSELQRDLDGVNAQIVTTTAQDKLQALLDRRAILSGQITDLSQRAQAASLGSPRLVAGTRIIDAPHPTSRSPLVSIALFTVMGLVLGGGLGVGVAAVATVVRDRPVLRRDIAAHLGASVVAQLPAPLRGPSRLWRRGRAEEEHHRTAATMVRLVRADSGPVSILELGCAGVAARLAVEIADELAQREPVLLVDDLPGGELRSTARPNGKVRIVEGRNFPADGAEPKERQLAVGSVAPGTPWTDLRRLGPEAMVVVRAGSAEAAWLHTVARQLADAGIAIVGVVVVHPDPRDRSDGTLWDAVHTAIRGRAAGAKAAGLVIPDVAALIDLTVRNIAAERNGHGATHPLAAANGHASTLGLSDRSGGVAVIDPPRGSGGAEHPEWNGPRVHDSTRVPSHVTPTQPTDRAAGQPTIRDNPVPVQSAEPVQAASTGVGDSDGAPTDRATTEVEAPGIEPATGEESADAGEPAVARALPEESDAEEPDAARAQPEEPDAEAPDLSAKGSAAVEAGSTAGIPGDDGSAEPAAAARVKRRPRPRLRPPASGR